MDVEHPRIHGLLHLHGRIDETHEVDRLGAASYPSRQFVSAGFFHRLGRYGVFGHSRTQRRQAAPFHADERRMIQDAGRHGAGPDERQLVDVEIDREIHFPVRPFYVGCQELGLQVEELIVVFDRSGRDVKRVQVGHVAVAVHVSGLPHRLAVGIDQGDIQPDLGLSPQRTRRQIMPLVGIGDLIGEAETLPGAGRAVEVGAVHTHAVLENLAAQFPLLLEQFQVCLDDRAGVFPVKTIGPGFGEFNLDLAFLHLVFPFRIPPGRAIVELQPFLDTELLGIGVVREDAGMGDGIARTVEGVVVVNALRIDFLAGDDGGGPVFVALRLPGHTAHVAFLAGNALLGGRRIPVLLPHHFQLDARIDGNLMA